MWGSLWCVATRTEQFTPAPPSCRLTAVRRSPHWSRDRSDLPDRIDRVHRYRRSVGMACVRRTIDLDLATRARSGSGPAHAGEDWSATQRGEAEHLFGLHPIVRRPLRDPGISWVDVSARTRRRAAAPVGRDLSHGRVAGSPRGAAARESQSATRRGDGASLARRVGAARATARCGRRDTRPAPSGCWRDRASLVDGPDWHRASRYGARRHFCRNHVGTRASSLCPDFDGNPRLGD
jgi:hypothetical protein